MFSIIFFLLLCRIFQSYMPFLHEKYITRKCIYKQTCFPEDYEPKKNNRLYYEYLPEPPLYTLIWYDCDSCKKLLQDMEILQLKNVYINGGEYFYDVDDLNSKFNTPLLYKEEVFIGDNLFDIYAEIYRGI